MLELKIGSKTYKVEYSVESALYRNCTEGVAEFLTGSSAENSKEAIKNLVSQIADLPGLALNMFYAGLMEHHGELGDRTVLSVDDARILLTQLIKENANKELGNFYGIVNKLLSAMGEDGFFDMIGLREIAERLNQTTEEIIKMPNTKKNNRKSN